jgi:DNA-directed RNA polymerase specialized sigma24 family protein
MGEAAQRMGVSAGTFRVQISRIREQLRKGLATRVGEENLPDFARAG